MTTLQADLESFWGMVIDEMATKSSFEDQLAYALASIASSSKMLAGQIDALRWELRQKGVEVSPKFEGTLAAG